MALQLDYQINTSTAVIPAVYWKITYIDFCPKQHTIIYITPFAPSVADPLQKVAIDNAKQFLITNDQIVFDDYFSIDALDTSNIIENSYNYLKTLTQFTNAINV